MTHPQALSRSSSVTVTPVRPSTYSRVVAGALSPGFGSGLFFSMSGVECPGAGSGGGRNGDTPTVETVDCRSPSMMDAAWKADTHETAERDTDCPGNGAQVSSEGPLAGVAPCRPSPSIRTQTSSLCESSAGASALAAFFSRVVSMAPALSPLFFAPTVKHGKGIYTV